LELLEQELDNLRTALAWSQEQAGDPEGGLRLAAALWSFWAVRGYWQEGLQWLAGLLALPGPAVPTPGRAQALLVAGGLAWDEGDSERAASLCEKSLVMFRELGDKRGVAYSLHHMAISLSDLATDADRAGRLNEESLALFRELGDKRGTAWALFHLGCMAGCEGDYKRAAGVFEESLVLSREAGDNWCIATSLYQLAGVASCQGCYQQAARLSRQSLVLFRELGDKLYMPMALLQLGRVARCQGKYERAAVLLAEAMTLFRVLGDRHSGRISPCLEEFVWVFRGQGRLERAVQLLGAAERLREASGAGLSADERAEYEASVAALRTALGEGAFAAARAEGRAMSLEAAIELALKMSDTSSGDRE
jgi:tetratricopeptide (TPR) repeat protein